MKQKIAAIFLTLCMVLSMFNGIPVYALEGDEKENQGEQATGLVAKDWIDWGENGPAVNPEAEWVKETWADLNGSTLCLGYVTAAGQTPDNVSAEDISIYYEGNAVTGEEAVCSINEQNGELLDFQFYKVGDYTITYKENTVTTPSVLTIHVDFPSIGFYKTDEMTEEGFIREIKYERRVGKTFYIIPNPSEEWGSFTYKVMTEETYDDGAFITINGQALDTDKAIEGSVKVTITEDAKCGFGIKAVGAFTDSDGNKGDWEPEQFLWCEDTYEGAPVIEDEEEHKGFAGCFITEKAYKDNQIFDEGQEDAQYWVHAETLQGVVDKLVDAANAGSVKIGEEEYPVSNTGYIWTNVSYLPDYENNTKVTQYITTPEEVKGVILSAGSEVYYANDPDEEGIYYPVQCWRTEEEAAYYVTCQKDDGLYYAVTGDTEQGFILEKEAIGQTETELREAGYSLDEGFGIECQLPELHVDATTNVKITGNFAEAEENKANVYLGLYEDSNICSEIVDAWDDAEECYHFIQITSDNIRKNNEITTDAGVKVKVVKLTAETDTSVKGNFISGKDVAMEEGTGEKTLRNKLGLEKIIAKDEALKQAIIDGETLKVALTVNSLEEQDGTQSEAVQNGIAKISEIVNQQINPVSKIQYLDMNLKYQVGEQQGDITETKDEIALCLTLPEGYAKAQKQSAKSYTPVVYRYHDGKAEKLESVFENGKLTFKTDKFSLYAIAIEEVVPTAIKITSAPDKTAYTAGEKFDKTGMVVEVVYSDGSTEQITDYTVPSAVLTEADKEIVVLYGELTVKQAIMVKAVPVSVSSTPASSTSVKVGDSVTVNGNQYKVTSAADNQKTVTYVSGNKKAAKITIPATIAMNGSNYQVTAIADNAFAASRKLTAVTIPAGITRIGSNAFKGCKKLTSISFKGARLTKIGKGAFQGCSSLKSVTIPKSVKEIEKNAFYGCKKLSKVTIKGTAIKKIGKNAFQKIAKKAVVKVPKKKKAAYRKLLAKAGYKGSVK